MKLMADRRGNVTREVKEDLSKVKTEGADPELDDPNEMSMYSHAGDALS